MRDRLSFHTLRAQDLRDLVLQPSQSVALGIVPTYTDEMIEAAAAQRVAWSVRCSGRLICCFGIIEGIPGRQGLGWANLASGIGYAHLQLTRFIRGQIEACGLPRLEVLAKAPDIEPLIAKHPGLDSGQLVSLAMSMATPEMRWATLLGLTPAHVLRCYGGDSETVLLFESIKPANAAAALLEEAA